jgi:hydroxymethylpyrimidine/phosphomethylpyrimidine kinase
MNNFTSIMEKSDSWEIMVSDITNYLDKVNKKMLPLNVRDAIYFTKKYNLLSRESIEEIRDASKGSLKMLSKKYNIPEAEILLGDVTLDSQNTLPAAARQLAEQYNTSVLLKAGHLIEDRLVDYFYDIETKTMLELPSARIRTQNTHGTGCTMSSAFAAQLSQGKTLQQAAIGAKDYVANAILSGADYEIGHGHGPVNHFYKL